MASYGGASGMQYKVVRSEGFGLLERQVNEAMKTGWECVGGVSICPSNFNYSLMKGIGETTSFCVTQAMIMRDPRIS